jgi:hypothetical protein
MRSHANRAVSVVFSGLLGFLLAAGGTADRAAATEHPLSETQLAKVKSWLVEHGGPDSISKIVTDILGLTQGNETVTSRALAVHGSDSPTDIHQIDILPSNKGYLEAHFHDGKAEIFWADLNFNLQSAVEGARDARPGLMSFPEAQAGLNDELAWWATFADTH